MNLRRIAGESLLRVGRILERRATTLPLAEATYSAARGLIPRRATALFRLGRVRERRQNWPGAECAYAAAIALDPPNIADYLARRAAVLERQGRYAEAIADCRAVPGMEPPRRLVIRLAEDYRRDGNVPEAIELLERGLEQRPTAKLWAALAECRAEMGAFGAAHEAYTEAARLAPDNLTIRTGLGRLAAQRSVVPFDIQDGEVTAVAVDKRERAFAVAVEQLAGVVAESPSRTRAAHDLGRVMESHRRLLEALDAYCEAISRVQRVDEPWAHRAELAWTFRRDYVAHRISGEAGTDSRLNRTAQPGQWGDNLSGVAGFFEATITHEGISLEGFVLHGHDGVDVRVNGRSVLRIAGKTAWNRTFKTTIVNGVVGEFPPRAELTLRVGDTHLVTVGGAQYVDVAVPDGTGKLANMLDAGRTVTKKGRWSDALIPTGEQDDLYFAAYDKARRFFEDELGVSLFVSYGTLLGCYRDGLLIPGDDDFDVSYVSEATSPEELKEDGSRVIRALLRGGFDSRVAVDGRMFHLRVGKVVLDVNPFWFSAGRAWAFDAHNLGRDVFDPVSSLKLHGMEVYIPGDTEAFLQENYGADWRTPRSDFQYYRDKSDQATLRLARLAPSEVQALRDYSERLRATDPVAGRFHGYGDPTNPRFEDAAVAG
ncbi:MAG TPA: LicD family protein [Jiangellaceae bacterium]|nr:LicD family protein [Jiangellaceae bacterium]